MRVCVSQCLFSVGRKSTGSWVRGVEVVVVDGGSGYWLHTEA